MCLHFFPRIPGVPEDPHDVLKKRDSASWSPAPSHLPPAPSCTEELHQPVSTAITTKQWDYSETRPPLVWTHCGGVVVLSTSFFYFFFLDKFTPFIPLFLPLHRELLQSLDCFKKLNDKNHSRGGKSPHEAKGTRFGNLFGLPVGATDRSDWMKFTSRLVERSNDTVARWWWRDYTFLFTGEKKKETKF